MAGKCIFHFIRDVTACLDSGTLLNSICFYKGMLINPQPDLLPDVVDGIDSVVGNTGLFMCRTASLFLLQRLKGSMSDDVRDFNNIETQAVIKFFFPLQGRAPNEIHTILTETLGKHAPSYATIKNWVAQFKHGDFSTHDAPHPGRPKRVTTPQIIYQIHKLILEDCQISAKSRAEQLGIPREWLWSIIHAFMKIWTCGSSPQSGS